MAVTTTTTTKTRENVAELSRTSSRHHVAGLQGRGVLLLVEHFAASSGRSCTKSQHSPSIPNRIARFTPALRSSEHVSRYPISIFHLRQIDRDSGDSIDLRREMIAKSPSPFLIPIRDARSTREIQHSADFESTWKLLISDGCYYYYCSRWLNEDERDSRPQMYPSEM